MAGVGFKTNLNMLEAAIGRIETAVSEQGELLAAIGETLVTGTHERFEEQVGPDGEAWPASPRGKSPLLVDTARLKNSINHQEDEQNVYVGTNVIYAAIHQYGGEITPKNAKSLAFPDGGRIVFRRKVKIPARPFIGISVKDKERIFEQIAEIMAEAAKP